ncbi:snare Ykt6 [Phaeosphaeria sp. MPI-PUGE-AT-0046c]|nr:snare Ykt6 [Phaeosphaeria sp. MPI-PUGE-AT-0046c]
MKILYISVFRNEPKDACLELAVETQLSSINRFMQGGVAQGLTFAATQLARATQPGTRHNMDPKRDDTDTSTSEYMFYSFGHSAGLCGIVAADKEYPDYVAYSLAGKVVNDFANKYPRTAYADLAKPAASVKGSLLPMPELKELITTYQDPAKADNLTKIQKELDETKEVLHNTMQSVLQRGEKIDDLVAKSDVLSASSKMFYTQAKKQNSCCNVM